VSTPLDGAPGCLVLSHSPLVIAGGDAFTHSNFDGCVESALSIVNKFVNSKM
jgi:renalase